MKKNLLKSFAVITALFAGGVICNAQEPYVGTSTVDTWLRKGNTANHSGEATMELQTYYKEEIVKDEQTQEETTKITDNDMVGVMVFEFTAPNDGYEIESASLRLVSERVKGDRNINIYDFDADIKDDAKYADYAAKITEARTKEPIAKFSMEGQLGKSVASDEITAEKYQVISGWQNKVDLTEYVKGLSTNKFGILITRAANVSESSKIFTKEATKIENKKTDFSSVTAEDLVPQLTITYTVAAGISDITTVTPEQANGAIYNLAGQRVSSLQKGSIYIKNGKKYIAR